MRKDEMNLRIKLTPEAKKVLDFWASLSGKTQGELASAAIVAKAPEKALDLTDDFIAEKHKGEHHLHRISPPEPVPPIKREFSWKPEPANPTWTADPQDTDEELLRLTDRGIPLKDDQAAQELIRRWLAAGKSSRWIAAKLHRGKTSINNWRAAQKVSQ